MTIAAANHLVYERPKGFTETPTHYCPGCTHGVAHRLVAEVLEEMGILDRTIGVAPVGCAVFAYNYFDTDFVEAPHGRAPAMATGIKRVLPDRVVFTYQGDGDLASIGMGEIVHAAARGENISVIFINNANYGIAGYEDHFLPEWPRCGDAGLSDPGERIAFDARRCGLRGSPLAPRSKEHSLGEEGHSACL
jgi:TPP-dependent indolepyruvate ferredoxin oxidoreductase alpha subunit